MVMRALPFNLVVTNVPGPQVPLYLLGARMLDNYGAVPLTDYLGARHRPLQLRRTLCWGFTADWDLVPDLPDFVSAIEDVVRGAVRGRRGHTRRRSPGTADAAAPPDRRRCGMTLRWVVPRLRSRR